MAFHGLEDQGPGRDVALYKIAGVREKLPRALQSDALNLVVWRAAEGALEPLIESRNVTRPTKWVSSGNAVALPSC